MLSEDTTRLFEYTCEGETFTPNSWLSSKALLASGKPPPTRKHKININKRRVILNNLSVWDRSSIEQHECNQEKSNIRLHQTTQISNSKLNKTKLEEELTIGEENVRDSQST